MKGKRIVLVVVIVLLTSILYACGSGNSPKGVTEAFFSSMKKFDIEKMQECIVDGGEVERVFRNEDEKSKFLYNYFKENASNISFTVQEENIDGDTATVKVNVDYVDASEVVEDAVDEYFEQALELFWDEVSEDEMSQLFEKVFVEKMKTSNTKENSMTLELFCVKTENGWKILDVPEEVLDVMTANMIQTIEYYFD